MTGHNAKKPESAEAKRKREQREREDALGIGVVEVKLGPAERELLDRARTARGGVTGAYDAGEYLAVLLRRDAVRLEQQLDDLAGMTCGHCGYTLPQGCGGRRLGELPCWQTTSRRDLEL